MQLRCILIFNPVVAGSMFLIFPSITSNTTDVISRTSRSSLNILTNRVEPADAGRGLGARDGPSAYRGDGIIGESYTSPCGAIDIGLELG